MCCSLSWNRIDSCWRKRKWPERRAYDWLSSVHLLIRCTNIEIILSPIRSSPARHWCASLLQCTPSDLQRYGSLDKCKSVVYKISRRIILKCIFSFSSRGNPTRIMRVIYGLINILYDFNGTLIFLVVKKYFLIWINGSKWSYKF